MEPTTTLAQVLADALGRPVTEQGHELDDDTARALAAQLRAIAELDALTPLERALRRDMLAAADVLEAH